VTADEEPDFVMLEGDGGINAANTIVVDKADAERAINAVLNDVWSGLHHDDNDAEDEENDDAGDEGAELEGGDEAGNVEDRYEEWDDDHEISALDLLGEDFERNSIINGKSSYALSSVDSTHKL
jgi:hypothetical protein